MGEFLRCPYSFALLRSLAQLAARLLTIATTMRSGFFCPVCRHAVCESWAMFLLNSPHFQ